MALGWMARGVAVALAAAATAGAPVLAQVEIRPRLEAGAETRYDVSYDLKLTNIENGGEPRVSTLHQKARLLMSVKDVGADGVASIAVKVERLSMDRMQVSMAGRFERPQLTAEVVPDTKENAALAAICQAILDAPVEIKVQANGAIVGASGLTGILEAVNAQTVWDQSVLGIFTPRQFATTLERALSGDGASAAARSVGDTWDVNDSLALGPAGRFEVKATMRLDSATESEAVITGAPFYAVVPPEAAEATTPRVEIKVQDSSIRVSWDLASGWLRERRGEQNIHSVWTMQPTPEMTLVLDQMQEASSGLTRVDE